MSLNLPTPTWIDNIRSFGIPISVIDNDATVIRRRVQFRFSRSRRRRIRRKWSKRPENYRDLPPEYHCFYTTHGLLMPRKLYEELRKMTTAELKRSLESQIPNEGRIES